MTRHLATSERGRMDGGWWACYCGADCRLFVNPIHGEVNHAGIDPERWQKFERPSQPY